MRIMRPVHRHPPGTKKRAPGAGTREARTEVMGMLDVVAGAAIAVIVAAYVVRDLTRR